MKSLRRRISVIGAVTISVLSVTVSTVAEAAPAPAVSDLSAAPGTQDPAKLRALQDINDIVEKNPDHFAGTFTDGLEKITIYRAGDAASSRFDVASALRVATTAGIQTEVQNHKYSLRELTTLKDSIPEVEPFKSRRTELISWGVDTKSNTVLVGVAAVTPELVDVVRAAFGDKIALKRDVRDVATASRFDDIPKYLGGNRLRVGNWGCTGGFTIVNATGLRYALTAGHCYGVGAEVVLERSNHFFGTVQFNHYIGSKLDNALVGVNVYRGGIWTGPAEGNLPAVRVTSAANSCQGCQVFFDGSVTGQALATIESAGNAETCRDIRNLDGVIYTACHLVTVRGSSGLPCQDGDSGGPVFAYDGQGGATAVGIITSINAAEGVCRYTRIVPILWYWQSTIDTVM
jgi:hypothetical protein